MYKHFKKKPFFYLGKKWLFYVIFTSFSSKKGKTGVLFMLPVKARFKKRKAFVQKLTRIRFLYLVCPK